MKALTYTSLHVQFCFIWVKSAGHGTVSGRFYISLVICKSLKSYGGSFTCNHSIIYATLTMFMSCYNNRTLTYKDSITTFLTFDLSEFIERYAPPKSTTIYLFPALLKACSFPTFTCRHQIEAASGSRDSLR